MHDIVTGYYVPNDEETKVNITAGFGATTNIINGEQECGQTDEDARGQNRINAYKAYLEYFGLPEETTGLTCGSQPAGKFPENGSYGYGMYAYFEYNEDAADGDYVCTAVDYQTEYSIYTYDDYKRCICKHIGNGKADCGQAE